MTIYYKKSYFQGHNSKLFVMSASLNMYSSVKWWFQWWNYVIWARLQFHFWSEVEIGKKRNVPVVVVVVELQGYMRFNLIEILVGGWVHSTVFYQIKITFSDSSIIRNWFIGWSINDCWLFIFRKSISRVMHQWFYIIFFIISIIWPHWRKNSSLIGYFEITFLIWLMF